MSKWIDYKMDSPLIAKPFLNESRSGGKGYFQYGDNPRSILLGGMIWKPEYQHGNGFFGDVLKNVKKNTSDYIEDKAYKTLSNIANSPLNFGNKALNRLETHLNTIGGQSYPQYYQPIIYPLYHQPRRKMYYD